MGRRPRRGDAMLGELEAIIPLGICLAIATASLKASVAVVPGAMGARSTLETHRGSSLAISIRRESGCEFAKVYATDMKLLGYQRRSFNGLSAASPRSAACRVGKEYVSTCRALGWQAH